MLLLLLLHFLVLKRLEREQFVSAGEFFFQIFDHGVREEGPAWVGFDVQFKESVEEVVELLVVLKIFGMRVHPFFENIQGA